LSSDQELKIAEAHANAMFAGIQLYREYMKKCEPMIMTVIPRQALKHRDDAVQAVWIRAYAWMPSAARAGLRPVFFRLMRANPPT